METDDHSHVELESELAFCKDRLKKIGEIIDYMESNELHIELLDICVEKYFVFKSALDDELLDAETEVEGLEEELEQQQRIARPTMEIESDES